MEGMGGLGLAVSSAEARLLRRIEAHLLEVPDNRDHAVIRVADRLERGGRQVCEAAHERTAIDNVTKRRSRLTQVVVLLTAAGAAVPRLGPDPLAIRRVDDLNPLRGCLCERVGDDENAKDKRTWLQFCPLFLSYIVLGIATINESSLSVKPQLPSPG